MKKLLAFLTISAAAAAFSISTSAENINGYVYAVKDDGTAVITCYDTDEYGSLQGDITIPEEIDGYTVTEIADFAFGYQSGIHSVEIPESVRVIGYHAFGSCYGLEEVIINEGVEIISESAFEDCGYLQEIIIPDSVTAIGERAFYGCTAMKKAVIGKSIRRIDAYTFTSCYNLSDVTIGENVRDIFHYAFSDCNIEKIYIPISIRFIGEFAFDGNYDIVTNYEGNREQWEDIEIGYGNSELNYNDINFNRNRDGRVNAEITTTAISIYTAYIVTAALLIGAVIFLVSRKNDKCRHCGAQLEENSSFCGNCGTKLK